MENGHVTFHHPELINYTIITDITLYPGWFTKTTSRTGPDPVPVGVVSVGVCAWRGSPSCFKKLDAFRPRRATVGISETSDRPVVTLKLVC